MSTRRSTVARLIISLILLAGAVWIVFNRTYVVDQLTVWRYPPSKDAMALATNSSMNDGGKFLFYASRPMVQEKAEFNQACRKHAEKTAILGCYTGRTIHLYNITDPRLEGIKEVTAAHEMLHAAYERLSDNERKRVDGLIDQASAQVNSPNIQRKLKLYETTEPGERYNELHSMLGSEASNLPPELEQYYSRYFTNRLALVSLAERYETVFNELESQQKQLVSELNTLADEINSDNVSYESQFSSLQSAVASFNTRASNGSFSSESQFNAERSRLVSKQASLSAFRDGIIAKIGLYDKKKTVLDALNLTAEGLQKSIDSNAPAEVPSI
jgi:hypothetical protein